MSDVSALFTPFTLAGMELPNRIVMAPMTRSKSPGGVPTADVAAYYARRAAADVGLIVTEGTTIDRPGASSDPNVPNFHTPEALAAWSGVAAAVHDAGGKIAPQLWHVGLTRKPGTGPHPDAISDSPSGTTHTGKQVAPVLSDEDLADIISAYGRAAGQARATGFDCIEIHGAHGYLIDQFFWEPMNQRGDRFGGGDLTARASFASEVIRACRAEAGDLPIILRFSQWKQQDYDARLATTPDVLEGFLKVFADAGVDALHCSQRRVWEPEFPEVDGENGLNLAGWAKKLTGLPSITVGSVGLASDFIGAFRGEASKARPLSAVVERLEKGEFDLVAVGRALLQDPEWAAKVRQGRTDELRDYDAASLATLY